MQCPSCAFEGDEKMNFCPACGARLRAISGVVAKMIEDYRKQLADNPHNPDAHYNLALAYLRAGEDHPAETELARVLTLEPEFADAYVHLAEIYLRHGQKEEALSKLKKALELEPDNLPAQRLLETASL